MSRSFLTPGGPYYGNYGAPYWTLPETPTTGYYDHQYRVPATLPHSTGFANRHTEPDSTQAATSSENNKQSVASGTISVTPNIHPVIIRTAASKRKATPVAEERKDDNYWERRNRNNESAKKSRAQRKEREIYAVWRCTELEKENANLRLQLDHCQLELKKLTTLLSGH